MINDFDFAQPANLSEALHALNETGRVLPIAGGTNVMVNMKREPLDADLVVDLSQLSELRSISVDGSTIGLGSGVTFADLLEWRPGGAVEGLMRPMAAAFAGPLIRNLATVGGNICDASAAADISPVLLALDARVHLESAKEGKRSLPIAEFFQGVRKTARRSNELLTHITFEKPADDERWFYYKLGKRKADAISIVSIAIRVKLNSDKVEKACIALGAVAPVAIRVPKAESTLIGQELDDSVITEAAATAETESRPIDDFRASGQYRRRMVEALVRRGLRQIKPSE